MCMSSTAKPDVVRLSINLAPDVAAELKRQADLNDVTATRAVRDAIAMMKFILDERARGNRIAVIEGRGRSAKWREIEFL